MVEYIAVNNYMFRPPSRPSSGCSITWNKDHTKYKYLYFVWSYFISLCYSPEHIFQASLFCA